MDQKPPGQGAQKMQRRQVQRSSNGCWTCKKRKKKCDETYPLCQRCIKAKITCFGYGDKPAWFERKSNSKAKKIPIGIGAAGAIAGGIGGGVGNGLQSAATSAFQDSLFANVSGGGVGSSSGSIPDSLLSKANRLKEHEAELLLYYLEFVFPLQWQFYKGSSSWVYPLLRQSKALYHSALSVAATYLAIQGNELDDDFQMHHQLTLQGLRNSITFDRPDSAGKIAGDNQSQETNAFAIDPSITGSVISSPSSLLHSLAAVVMLLSFELFQGGYQSWQQNILSGSALVALITNSATVPTQTEGECFLVSAMVWMEIISTATSGIPCQSSPYLDKLTESPNFIPLEQIMGCRTKVLLQLNEVTKLNAIKLARIEEFKYSRPLPPPSSDENGSGSVLDGSSSAGSTAASAVAVAVAANAAATANAAISALIVTELSDKVESIKKELDFALTGSISTEDSLIDNVTILFALAILIYLAGVTSGFSPENSEISDAVDRGIIVLDKIPSKYYRSLVFPICVLGSMAKPHFHDFFDSIFGEDPVQLAFGNVAQVRKVMKHTWILRNSVNGTDNDYNNDSIRNDMNWLDSMKDLNTLVLLV